MIPGERYIDYNKKPLNLQKNHQFVRLEVAGVTVSKARVLVASNATKSIVGGDWLVALCYKITQPIERGECKINKQIAGCKKSKFETSGKNKTPKYSNLWENFQNQFFKRKGRVQNYEIKIKM